MIRQKTTWKQIRPRVVILNKMLADMLDQLSPDGTLPLEIGHFKYGEEIANAYTHPQSFLILQKHCEVFFEFEAKPKIHSLLQPGKLICTHCLKTQDWKLTAGARSVWMLPKIGDHEGYKRIQNALKIEADKPTEFHTHWHFFKQIAHAPIAECNWECQVLFLDSTWPALNLILMQQDQKRQLIQDELMLLQRAIGLAQRSKQGYHSKFGLIQAEQLMYLFHLGLGHAPGFKAAQSEEALPLQLIQSTYLKHYGLKDYAPVILAPTYFDWTSPAETPLYASLNYSTAHYHSPQANAAKTHAKALDQLAWSCKKLQNFLHKKDFLSERSQLHQFMQSCEFTFYHKEAHAGFTSPEVIHLHDSTFMRDWDMERFQFPTHSLFWQGCVGIKWKPS